MDLEPLAQVPHVLPLCPVCNVPFERGACGTCGVIWRPDRVRERCAVCWHDYTEIERVGRKRAYESDFIGPLPPSVPPEDDIDWLLLPCGHRYCAPCFTKSVEMHVRGEGSKRLLLRRQSSVFGCVQCRRQIDEGIVRANVQQPLYDAYLRSGLRAALAALGPAVRHCPRPGCEYAVVIDEQRGEEQYDPEFPTGVVCAQAVQCGAPSCGGAYCAACGEGWVGHEGKSCWQLERERLTPDERANRTWKRANAKACPCCYAAIEKNGGCAHVTCTRCGHEWCWLCCAKYQPGHRCPALEQQEQQQLQQIRLRAQERDEQRRDQEQREPQAAAQQASEENPERAARRRRLFDVLNEQAQQQLREERERERREHEVRARKMEMERAVIQRTQERRVMIDDLPEYVSGEETQTQG